MFDELIPVTFSKIMQTRAYSVIIMEAERKLFPIYVEPSIGKAIQMELTEIKKARPLTHDMLHKIFKGLEVKILQVVLNDLEDTIYFARLFIEQKTKDETHILEIDARPSDCLTLAIMNDSKIYCTRQVLEKTIFLDDI